MRNEELGIKVSPAAIYFFHKIATLFAGVHLYKGIEKSGASFFSTPL